MRFVWILLGWLVHLSSVGVAAGPEGGFEAPKPWGDRDHSNTMVQLLAHGFSSLGREDELWLSCAKPCTHDENFPLFHQHFKYDKDKDILTFERPVSSGEPIFMRWDNGQDVTLDTVLGLVERTLRERHLICDHFKWSAILFQKPELRLCSQHLNELELNCSPDANFHQCSGNLPNLTCLTPKIYRDSDLPIELFPFLPPDWRQQWGAPPSCKLNPDTAYSTPFLSPEWMPKDDLTKMPRSQWPLLTHAGDNYARDTLETLLDPADVPVSNVGYVTQGQVPRGHDFGVPYQTRIKSLPEPTPPKDDPSFSPLGPDFSKLPKEMVQEICFFLSPPDKIRLMQAMPSLESIIKETMKRDFVPICPPRYVSRFNLPLILPFQSAHPKSKGSSPFFIETEMDWNHHECLLGSDNYHYVLFWEVKPDPDPRNPGTYVRTTEGPLAVCGPIEVSPRLAREEKIAHTPHRPWTDRHEDFMETPPDPDRDYFDDEEDEGDDAEFKQLLYPIVWHEFIKALHNPKASLLTENYHFTFRTLAAEENLYNGAERELYQPVDLKTAIPNITELFTRAEVAELGVRHPTQNIHFWIDLKQAFSAASNTLELMVDNGLNKTRFTLPLARELFNFCSLEGLYRSIKRIAADLLSGLENITGVPDKVYTHTSHAEAFFDNTLRLLTDHFPPNTPPLSASIQDLRLKHLNMPSSWSFKNVTHLDITDTTQQYHPNILHRIQPKNDKIKIYLPNAVSAPSCFNTPRFQVRRLGPLVLEYAGRSQGWATLSSLIKENSMCLGARYNTVSPQKPYLNHDALKAMLVKNDPTDRNTPQTITPSMPVFDAMINLLRSNSVVQFIEQITTKFKPGWGEDYFISLQNSIFQTQGMQCCIIEDPIGVQPIWVTPLDNQQKYKRPYLEFVLGLPCLIENKMPAPLHSYPQTTQQVKQICETISSHTFSYCWRTAEGTLLAQSAPVTLHHVEQFFPELALEPFNDFFLSILVDQLQQTSDESQPSAAPATLSLSSSTSNPRNSLAPSTHTNLSSPEPFADINQSQNAHP